MDISQISTEQRQEYARVSIARAKEALAREHNTHPSNWLTGKEVCDMLGISRPTLIAGRKSGKYVFAHHNHSRYYYDRRSIEANLRAVGAGEVAEKS